jgi:hypothetical protein
MPTWTEAQTYLRGRYQLRRDEPTEIELAWTFPGAPEVQRQIVELRRAVKRPLMVIRCDTGQSAFSEREALEHNMTLGVGALAIADGEYVLRHAMLLDELAWGTLDLALELVAHEAARLKRRRRGVPDLSAFMNFAE